MDTPFVSIILPIRNEAQYIERSLSAVLNQDYPKKCMEVIIADGMSTDQTRQIIEDLASQHLQIRVEVVDNESQIVPTGMNVALQKTKGEIVIRVDGHCVIAPDYVRNCVNHIQSNDIDCVGGSIHSVGETPIAEAIAIGMSSPFGVGNSAFRTMSDKSTFTDTVPFPAYTRQIIEHVGMYDEELVRNQDDEYNCRIRSAGGKILLANDVHSTYFSRASCIHLWRQYYQYGFWKVRVLQKHPRQMKLRQFIPLFFVLTLFISSLIYLSPALRPLSLIVPLFYLLANLFTSFVTALKYNWRYLPLLPIIFSTLHLSYGLGFLTGLIKFWNRWGDRIGKVPVSTNGIIKSTTRQLPKFSHSK
ncbi:MAG: glycosyltransferase [Anaerolineales bacterium]|jgi:glycosyltransferase involved in cell wall biosynthesis